MTDHDVAVATPHDDDSSGERPDRSLADHPTPTPPPAATALGSWVDVPEVLDVQAAGIMLAAPDGQLRVMASSSEAMRILELFEVQAQQGPCFDTYHADIEVAQAFADVATIAILQHRAAIEARDLAQQLTHALNSRVMLEQAKGMIAERLDLDMEPSFAALRNHARNHNLRLGDVAQSVLDGSLATARLDAPPAATP